VGQSNVHTSLHKGLNPLTATSRATTFPGTTPNDSCVYLFRKWSNLVDHIVKNKIHDSESEKFNIPGLRKKLDEWERIICSGRTQKAKNKNDADVLRMPKTLKSLNLDDYQRTKKKLLAAVRKNADVEYSTIHQSKGREADVVRVANDILVDPTQYPLEKENESRLDDEKCLFYVALTRARETVLVDKQEQNI
jgi:superfamily I DNA/RNA helicase